MLVVQMGEEISTHVGDSVGSPDGGSAGHSVYIGLRIWLGLLNMAYLYSSIVFFSILQHA